MPGKRAAGALYEKPQKPENIGMEQMLQIMKQLGVPEAMRERALREYGGDPEKMTLFIIACLTEYDDRHEYMD